MAKKRKTKKQKIKAQARREVIINEGNYSIATESLPKTKKEPVKHIPQTTVVSKKDYSFVIADTKRTLLVATSLIVIQIILAALIQNDIINLPF